ncbi:MAG: SHOCT domain-containing protein [Ignavibacteria bacterium]
MICRKIKNNVKVSKSKLKEYKEALDEGLISQEEYDKAKKEFLNI